MGEVYRSRFGRTVTEADNQLFTHLTLNTNPLHFDEEYARRTRWGKILVNSTFTLSLVVGMSVPDVSEQAMANLGWSEVRLPHPVFVGDTLYCETEVLAMRESGSFQEAGIVTVRTRGVNQDGRCRHRSDSQRNGVQAGACAVGKRLSRDSRGDGRVNAMRSWLFVPGHRQRMIDKAAGLPADVLIYDLEDGVPADAKDAARRQVAAALGAASGRPARYVRVHPAGSAELDADLDAVARPGLQGLVLPKVQGP